MTAGAARQTMASYFNSLESKESALLKHAEASQHKQIVHTVSKHLSDSQARQGALSFFDGQVKKARAEAALVAKKLGVRKQHIATVGELLAAQHATAAAPATPQPPQAIASSVAGAAKSAAVAAASAKHGAAVRAAVKGELSRQGTSSETDKAAAGAYASAFNVRHPEAQLRPEAGDKSKAPAASLANAAASTRSAPVAPSPLSPLSKEAAHALAAAALQRHDAEEEAATQHMASEQRLLRKHAAAAAWRGMQSGDTAGARKGKVAAVTLVRPELEQWPYVP